MAMAKYLGDCTSTHLHINTVFCHHIATIVGIINQN
jgi:hypothetical protein